MSKPLATDEFMRRNGRSMWVASGAEGERTQAIKAALKGDSNEEQTEDDE